MTNWSVDSFEGHLYASMKRGTAKGMEATAVRGFLRNGTASGTAEEGFEMKLYLGESGPLDETLHLYRIPANLREGLIAYVGDGRPTGGFLECVLSNDLQGAVVRADETSAAALYALVKWLYMEAPSACWGSPGKVAAWIARHAEMRASGTKDCEEVGRG